MTTKIDIKETAQILLSKDNILILSHKNPDGDTLGSAAGLAYALMSLGKQCAVACHNKIPDKYSHLQLPMYSGQFTPEYIVSVDVAGANLLGDNLAQYSADVDLSIDHHRSNSSYSKLLCLDSGCPAAAQLVYYIIGEMGAEITPHIASCLYTGIVTDTGCFKYSSTTPKTHLAAARLMEAGADHVGIVERFFMTKTQKTVAMEKYMLNNLEYYFDGRCALLCLTGETLKRIAPEPTDVDGLASAAREFEGVEVSVLIKQVSDGAYKISIRTAENVDASAIARSMGGGGHVRAAGCEVQSSLENAKKAVLREVERHICN